MSIKTALLAMALGVASAGLAHANPMAAPEHAPRTPAHVPASHDVPHAAPGTPAAAVPPHAGTLPAPAAPHAPAGPHAKADSHHRAQARFQVGQHLTRAQVQQATHVNWKQAGLRAPKKGEQWLHVHGQRVLIQQSNDRVLRVG